MLGCYSGTLVWMDRQRQGGKERKKEVICNLSVNIKNTARQHRQPTESWFGLLVPTSVTAVILCEIDWCTSLHCVGHELAHILGSSEWPFFPLFEAKKK